MFCAVLATFQRFTRHEIQVHLRIIDEPAQLRPLFLRRGGTNINKIDPKTYIREIHLKETYPLACHFWLSRGLAL